jgi:hypothetical protein
MITNILAALEGEMRIDSFPGNIVFIVMLFIYVGIIVLVISLMIRLARYISAAGKERKLLRIELGKLAEEVQLIRKEIKQVKEQSNP